MSGGASGDAAAAAAATTAAEPVSEAVDGTLTAVVNTNEDASDDDGAGEEKELGEGWYGASRPAPKRAAPPPPSRDGRRELYTTTAVKVADDVFSEKVRSERVWYDAAAAADEEAAAAAAGDDPDAFDVDVSANPVTAAYDVEPRPLRRADYHVIKAGKSKATGEMRSIKCVDVALAAQLGVDVDSLKDEIKLAALCGARCANIVTADGGDDAIYASDDGDTLCFVLEHVAGAELFTQLSGGGGENYTEADARALVAQVLEAVRGVHAHKVVHRDVNDFVFSFARRDAISELKLTDFSLATRADGDDALSDVPGGSAQYQAPEQHAGNKYGAPCDVWAAGVLAFALLSGELPFDDANSVRLAQKVKKGEFAMDAAANACWAAASDDAKAFVRSLLVVDPAARPTAEQALKHAWFSSSAGAVLPTFKANLKKLLGERDGE